MWRLIKFLFTGDWHTHNWEILKEVPVRSIYDNNQLGGTRYYCKCDKCGEIRTFGA